jgi:glycosyltransferase involved in cell wall biosynthesis
LEPDVRTPSNLSLTVLIPAKNEGVHLSILLRILPAIVTVDHEILIVHDDESDNCVPVVKRMANPRIRAVHNRLGRGVTNALKAGVAEAKGEWVVICSADELGPLAGIEYMVELMREGCEFVSSTRYAYGGGRVGGSPIGALLSRMANLFFQAFGGKLSDTTTGMKMFRRSDFAALDLKSGVGWAVAFELGIKAQLLKLRMGEVPSISIDRPFGGTSSFSLGPWLIEYLRWFVWGARALASSDRYPYTIQVRVPPYLE